VSRFERAPRTFHRLAAAGVIAAIGLTSIGCGGGDWGYVQGVVTLGGSPIGPGTLILEPADPESGIRAITASFGEDGRFELKSGADEPGVPAGEYRVRIFTDEQAAPTQPSKIPRRYSDYSTSGLTANVQPGDNTIDFELKS
jgi:hypothetical protein